MTTNPDNLADVLWSSTPVRPEAKISTGTITGKSPCEADHIAMPYCQAPATPAPAECISQFMTRADTSMIIFRSAFNADAKRRTPLSTVMENAIRKFTPCIVLALLFSLPGPVLFASSRVRVSETCDPPSEGPSDDSDSCSRSASEPHQFLWPAVGRVVFECWSRTDGVNLAVKADVPIRAIETGIVAYVGNYFRRYGTVVMIRHPNGFVSAYANIGDSGMRRGDRVARGQIIAASSKRDGSATPFLHFELRKDGVPVDPWRYLACRSSIASENYGSKPPPLQKR